MLTKERPSAPGVIQPAGNPEKESRDMLDRNPSISHEKEDGGSTPSMSAGKQDKGVLLPPILGLARFTRRVILNAEDDSEQNRLSPPSPSFSKTRVRGFLLFVIK